MICSKKNVPMARQNIQRIDKPGLINNDLEVRT